MPQRDGSCGMMLKCSVNVISAFPSSACQMQDSRAEASLYCMMNQTEPLGVRTKLYGIDNMTG